MGIFSKLFAQNSEPDGGIFHDIYKLIFCDDIEMYLNTDSSDYPWSDLKKPTKNGLNKIISDSSLETRIKLVALKILENQFNYKNAKTLLGIVIEVPQAGGLDVLAVYQDKSIRYINQGKNLLVWESKDDSEINKIIDKMFELANPVFKYIGPWEKERLPAPKDPIVRISFISPDGIYFGQGPKDIFFQDEMAGPILLTATLLLQKIVEKSEKK